MPKREHSPIQNSLCNLCWETDKSECTQLLGLETSAVSEDLEPSGEPSPWSSVNANLTVLPEQHGGATRVWDPETGADLGIRQLTQTEIFEQQEIKLSSFIAITDHFQA